MIDQRATRAVILAEFCFQMSHGIILPCSGKVFCQLIRTVSLSLSLFSVQSSMLVVDSMWTRTPALNVIQTTINSSFKDGLDFFFPLNTI